MNQMWNEKEPCNALEVSLKKFDFRRHEGPERLTHIMDELRKTGVQNFVHIPHWHQVTDFEGMTVYNMLRDGRVDINIRNKLKRLDLLQLLSLCMQFVDSGYSAYVQALCERKTLCLDEEEDDL